MYDVGDINTTRLCEGFEPRCDVHAVAENIVARDDNVVQVDPYSERNPMIGHLSLVESRNCFTQSSGATHGLNDTLELDKNLVARPPDEMTTEFEDLRLDDFGSQEC